MIYYLKGAAYYFKIKPHQLHDHCFVANKRLPHAEGNVIDAEQR